MRLEILRGQSRRWLFSHLMAVFFGMLAYSQLALSKTPLIAIGTVDGNVPIHYQVYGNEIGEPILFLHPYGGYFDEDRFEPVIDFFSGYKFVGIDIRGHGRSGKPRGPDNYGLEMVEDVNRVLDHLGMSDAHIVGWSMGGIVGLKYASLYPERVRSLTLVGQGLVPEENFRGWIQMGLDVSSSDERTAEQEANMHMYDGLLAGYLPLLVTNDEANSLLVPVLIVIGEEDERVQSAKNLNEVYANTHLIVAPGYDHGTIMNLDSPLYISIDGFIRNLKK